METFSSPMILHTCVLELRCFQMDARMHSIHISLWRKTKHPNHNKTRQQSITKNAKPQLGVARGKNQDVPRSEKVREEPDALKQPEAGLVVQPKHPNVSETNFKALV